MGNKKNKAEAYEYHNPVLRDLTIDLLITKTDGIYIDGTLGGGGHAANILAKLISGGKLLAFDKDMVAINYSRTLLHKEEIAERLIIINDCFSKAYQYAEKFGNINGLLLDLGVSSKQLDSDSIGLSYRIDSQLDMRFASNGETARDIINQANYDELYRILRDYGEEPFAEDIVRRIIERRRIYALQSTFDLRAIIEEIIPEKYRTQTLSRVFQALRIAVNDELGSLERGLHSIIPLLETGGRIVVMSYHSLEDRITKNIFKEYSGKENPQLKIITKKPIIADYKEIKKNPRARSVKIRVAEKI